MSEWVCKSVFCVAENVEYDITYLHDKAGNMVKNEEGKYVELDRTPTEYYGLAPQQICDSIINKWVGECEGNTGFVAYCLSASGMPHIHAVLESNKAFRPLSILKRLYPKMHIEPTRGNKKQVEDYVNKKGQFEEKGEVVVATSQVGEIKGAQGKRTDLIDCLDLHRLIFEEGKTPREILKEYPIAYKSYNLMMKMYNDKLDMTVPVKRNVKVTWLVGETETGKSHIYVELCEKYGRDKVYRVANYEHPFDDYIDEPILVLDEFRDSCFKFNDLLNIIEGYYGKANARYINHTPQWTEVYVTSPLLPYECYNSALRDKQDKAEQFYRRINLIVHCSAIICNDSNGVKTKYVFRRKFKPYRTAKAQDYRDRFANNKLFDTKKLEKGDEDIFGLVYKEPVTTDNIDDDVIDIFKYRDEKEGCDFDCLFAGV